ncbi:MAG: hypothetical protein WC942_07305 [Clostridia bacterium]|jgi:hypothetical protein
MLSNILKDSVNTPKTIGYKLNNGLATLADEEDACTKPLWAYKFALVFSEANIEKCQEAACKDPGYAYYFAMNIPGADIGKCCEGACKDSWYAYYFALNISGANIEKCQEAACKDPYVKILIMHICLPGLFLEQI